MKKRAIIKKSIIIRNLTASILLVLVLAASLTGATYAWFIDSSANIENVFTAGTVELSNPQIVEVTTETTPGSDIAFVPNSGEATVSVVNILAREELHRPKTYEGDTPEYSPADYRVARLTIDRKGYAWALNTMTGSGTDFNFNNAQGSVVRISESGDPIYFAIPKNAEGQPIVGQGPRTIVMTNEGEGDNIYFWVGFYLGGFFQKYHYDGTNLHEVGARKYLEDSNGNRYTPYNAVLDDNGYMWVVSRHARPFPETDGIRGVVRFNTLDLNADIERLVYNEPGNNPYSMMIDNNGDVWVSSGGPWGIGQDRRFIVYDGNNGSPTSVPIGLNVPAMRGFLQDSGGTIWATTVDGRLIRGTEDGTGWIFEEVASGLGELTGLGFDNQGLLWVVSYGNNHLYGFDTTNLGAGYGNRVIEVGTGPYAYDNFTRPGRTCKTVEWEFEVIGTKSSYVRVKPTAESNGSNVTINLYENNSNWRKGLDGDEWWYYGSESGPLVIPPSEVNDSKVKVVFEYCIPDDSNPGFEITLIAEAVQSTHGAIDTIWQTNPWRQ